MTELKHHFYSPDISAHQHNQPTCNAFFLLGKFALFDVSNVHFSDSELDFFAVRADI